MSSTNTNQRLEQFANNHGFDFDALSGLSMEEAERLDYDVSKISAFKKRDMPDRAAEKEEEVLETLEAAAEAARDGDDDDAGGDGTPGVREIQLPEGLDAETAAEVLGEYGATENPVIASGDVLESARADFADMIAEQTSLSAETFADQDLDILTAAFQEAGAGVPDTLRQTPQTGSVGGARDDVDEGFNAETLSLADRDRLELLRKKRTVFANRGIDKQVDVFESEMRDLAGVDDVEEIDWEAL